MISRNLRKIWGDDEQPQAGGADEMRIESKHL